MQQKGCIQYALVRIGGRIERVPGKGKNGAAGKAAPNNKLFLVETI
jgi:hypothetical protein